MADAVPLIGITTALDRAVHGPWDRRNALVPEAYLLGVEEAGGAPLLLPPQPVSGAVVGRVLDAVDGLVLAGGSDVAPELYGEPRDPRTQAPHHDRDAWERALLLGALDRDMPVLAICRGLQLLNAALGGTLVQHVPDVTDADHGIAPGVFAPTDVEIVDGTQVRDVLGAVGDRITVQCHHHQAIGRLADGLLVAARSADGLVEAAELPAHRFAVGVQWHPEQDAADRRLFAALARAAASGPDRPGPTPVLGYATPGAPRG